MVKWLRLMRHEDSAFLRSWLTAYTAAESALKRRSLYALNAEVQNMGHRVGRAVEANGGILAQLGAQALVQPAYMSNALGLLPQRQPKRRFG